METWFTSDTHFGHKNILEYEKEARPFGTLEEMHERIIDNWNRDIRPNDIVFHLGDFCFGKGYIKIASRLNGRKRLILGNHDTYPSDEYLRYFDKLYGVVFWQRCVLSHMPVHPNGLGQRWLLNVHGHLHSRNVTYMSEELFPVQIKDPNYFNVSTEQNNLSPFHSDTIMARLEQL